MKILRFSERKKDANVKIRIRQSIVCVCLAFGMILLGAKVNLAGITAEDTKATYAYNNEAADSTLDMKARDLRPHNLMRFHVIANSDSEEDQSLKYEVRDEILKKAAPRLAKSSSLEESRQILMAMEDELMRIAFSVVRDWNKDYPVSFDYGRHTFPAKSYGNIVFPGGEYEAIKIKIGEAQGANWWCVLFPPLCFVNVEESTSMPVDRKPAVTPDAGTKPDAENPAKKKENESPKKELSYKGKKVGFYLQRFFQ